MRALLVIASPLQFINAIEAKEYLKVSKIEVFFLSDGNERNENQISLMVEKLNIDVNLRLVRIPKKLSFFSRISFLKELQKLGYDIEIDYVIVGHFRSIYQAVLSNSFNNAQKIFVDDGTRTLDDINFLKNRGYKKSNYLFKRIIYNLFFIKPYVILDKYTFFTYYAKKFSISESKLLLIENNFSYLKSKKRLLNGNNRQSSKRVAFIGQSLVDSKLITLDNYLILIRAIDKYYKKKYSNFVIIEYYSHRNESTEVLNSIQSTVDWKILKNKLPLELQLLYQPQPLSEIGLFFSSVSETLSVIFDNEFKISSFYISPQYLLYRNNEIKKIFETNTQSKNIQLLKNYLDKEN